MYLGKPFMLLSVMALATFAECGTTSDAKYTQKADEPKIIRIDMPSAGREKEGARVIYKYKVGNEELNGTREVDTQTGTALNTTPGITVCYDPKNVKDSLMIKYGGNCPPKISERNP